MIWFLQMAQVSTRMSDGWVKRERTTGEVEDAKRGGKEYASQRPSEPDDPTFERVSSRLVS